MEKHLPSSDDKILTDHMADVPFDYIHPDVDGMRLESGSEGEFMDCGVVVFETLWADYPLVIWYN